MISKEGKRDVRNLKECILERKMSADRIVLFHNLVAMVAYSLIEVEDVYEENLLD